MCTMRRAHCGQRPQLSPEFSTQEVASQVGDSRFWPVYGGFQRFHSNPQQLRPKQRLGSSHVSTLWIRVDKVWMNRWVLHFGIDGGISKHVIHVLCRGYPRVIHIWCVAAEIAV